MAAPPLVYPQFPVPQGWPPSWFMSRLGFFRRQFDLRAGPAVLATISYRSLYGGTVEIAIPQGVVVARTRRPFFGAIDVVRPDTGQAVATVTERSFLRGLIRFPSGRFYRCERGILTYRWTVTADDGHPVFLAQYRQFFPFPDLGTVHIAGPLAADPDLALLLPLAFYLRMMNLRDWGFVIQLFAIPLYLFLWVFSFNHTF